MKPVRESLMGGTQRNLPDPPTMRESPDRGERNRLKQQKVEKRLHTVWFLARLPQNRNFSDWSDWQQERRDSIKHRQVGRSESFRRRNKSSPSAAAGTYRIGWQDGHRLNFDLPRDADGVDSVQIQAVFVLQDVCAVHSHLNNSKRHH